MVIPTQRVAIGQIVIQTIGEDVYKLRKWPNTS